MTRRAPSHPVQCIASPRTKTEMTQPEAGSMAMMTPTRFDGTYFWQMDCRRKAAALQNSPKAMMEPNWNGVVSA